MSAAGGGFPSSGRWGEAEARESERDTDGGAREAEEREREREGESESEREKKRAGGSRYIRRGGGFLFLRFS